MTAGEASSWVTVGLSLLALVLSVTSLRRTDRFNEKQLEFQETADRLNQLLIQREKEDGAAQQRAELSANLIKVGKHDYQLKVFNRGRGTARNVRLIDLAEGETILMADDIEERFPLPILAQHQSVTLIACIHLQSRLYAHIKLVWDDETGLNHELELTPAL